MPESKLITILFADVSGSTKLFELRGDVVARQLISYVLTLLGQVASEHEGRVIKTIGDEVMCTFADGASALLAAIAMQRRVAADGACASEHLAIRIGLHSGSVLVEADDTYGDAVNVASHVTSLANREQIMTTATTFAGAGTDALQARSLGAVYLRGKVLPIEVVEVVWRDMSNVTVLDRGLASGDHAGLAAGGLRLLHLGRSFHVNSATPPFTLGRDNRSSLVIEAELVSRHHAVIECKGGHFVLVDYSTNGTWVTLGSEGEVRLHRDQLRLRKTGTISLGQPAAVAAARSVRFECTGES